MTNNKYGFTVMELMMAMVIMVIIFLWVIPEYKLFICRSKNQAMSSQLLRAINLARTEAIMRNESTTLCKSIDLKSCSGEWQNGYIIKTKDQVLFTFHNDMKGILHWRVFPLHHKALQFEATGFPAAENSTFWYCEINAVVPSWAIVLSQSGRARLVDFYQGDKFVDDKGKLLNCI